MNELIFYAVPFLGGICIGIAGCAVVTRETGRYEWLLVWSTLVSCQDILESGGMRYKWIDSARAIAKRHSRVADPGPGVR